MNAYSTLKGLENCLKVNAHRSICHQMQSGGSGGFKDINGLGDEDKKCLLANVDAFLRDAKARQAYAK